MATGVFSIAMVCVWVIPLTWDTRGRMWLIAGLFGLFVLTSVVALLVLEVLKNNPQGLLARTRLEWQKDVCCWMIFLARSGGEANRSSRCLTETTSRARRLRCGPWSTPAPRPGRYSCHTAPKALAANRARFRAARHFDGC
jgi:hypothetical protein